jgi:hypothetical protein
MAEGKRAPTRPADEGGMLVAPGVLTEEDVARLKNLWTMTFSRHYRFENGIILLGSVEIKWLPPGAVAIQEGGA